MAKYKFTKTLFSLQGLSMQPGTVTGTGHVVFIPAEKKNDISLPVQRPFRESRPVHTPSSPKKKSHPILTARPRSSSVWDSLQESPKPAPRPTGMKKQRPVPTVAPHQPERRMAPIPLSNPDNPFHGSVHHLKSLDKCRGGGVFGVFAPTPIGRTAAMSFQGNHSNTTYTRTKTTVRK